MEAKQCLTYSRLLSMSCSKIPGTASHFVSRTENGPILVCGWFLYDQLAKNGFYIFKGLRRKAIYDKSYVTCQA